MELVHLLRLGILGAAIAAVFAAGFSTGGNRVQAKWDKAENLALKQQVLLVQQAEEERDFANSRLFENQLSLEDAELKAERLNDDLQTEINRAVVTTISVSTDNCPAVTFTVDPAVHFRLFNCAINNSCEAVPPADQTNTDFVPRAGVLTLVDGIYGRNNRRDSI